MCGAERNVRGLARLKQEQRGMRSSARKAYALLYVEVYCVRLVSVGVTMLAKHTHYLVSVSNKT
jgi:hypothetical protein